jgi:pyridoxamine 5'-phosphate oxidase
MTETLPITSDLDSRASAAGEPFSVFEMWMAAATDAEPSDPNAMSLATVGEDGMPNNRFVLLKAFDERGFVFYTNSESQKGSELSSNMKAAGSLLWKSLHRAIRFRGPVSYVADDEADAYLASRDPNSRIGSWASRQSSPLEHVGELTDAVARARERHGADEIARPPHWRGYRIEPVRVEFWRERPHRLHERIEFARPGSDCPTWTKRWLYP